MGSLTGTRDIRAYLRVVWRWKLLILPFLIVVPAALYLHERGQKPTYQSSALVGISQASVGGSALAGGGTFTTNNVAAIAELVTTTPVEDIAARLMKPRADPAQIGSEVTTTSDQVTGFLTISAQDPNADRAAEIANAFARAIGISRENATIASIRQAIAGVEAQLAPAAHPGAAIRASLKQQLSQLQASLSTQGSNTAILQAATPGGPTGTSPRRALEIGLLIGLMLAIGAVVLAENADRRLRSPDDLERLTGLPLLASIAPSAFSGALVTGSRDEEAFQTLRTSLTYFNSDAALRSVLITSAGEKEGKSTVATRLALAGAGAGLNVILVDADLRRAQTSARLGLTVTSGLASVLARQLKLADALVDFPVAEIGGATLRVLPAGSPPPNPAALMASAETERVVRKLESQCDLLIVDTPPALAVSDAMPLIPMVSGVVLIARLNESRREGVRRVQNLISAAHGNLLGVVATGVSRGVGDDSYASKYYSAAPADRKPSGGATAAPAVPLDEAVGSSSQTT